LLSSRLDKAHKHFGITWKDLGVDREEDYTHN
jgi:hypothetical protein